MSRLTKAKQPWNDAALVTKDPMCLSSVIALLCNSWNFEYVHTKNCYVHLCDANLKQHLEITDNAAELHFHFLNVFLLFGKTWRKENL